LHVTQTGPSSFRLEFASEEELRAEERAHLGAGGIFLRPAPALPAYAVVEIALVLVGRGERVVKAQVVGSPGGGLALQFEGRPADLVQALLATPAAAPGEPQENEENDEDHEPGTLWERLRALTPPQKALLALKADRMTRLHLVQDSDPQVLFALLKNPRIQIDEVVRVAKSAYLSFQAAELILKTSQFYSNVDVRLALIHNPKLPLPFALRILPTLPDFEVRQIARGAATSQPLKQAALRRVQEAK
jgi:hypothetical protein